MNGHALGILLPLTSRSGSAHELCRRLGEVWAPIRSLSSSVIFVLGVDEGDAFTSPGAVAQLQGALDGARVHVTIFSQADIREAQTAFSDQGTLPPDLPSEECPVPICWMWDVLAQRATQLGAGCFVLLGDDVKVMPAEAWASMLLRHTEQLMATLLGSLGCLVLNDQVDPGYPSFAVIGSAHFQIFGKLFPPGLFLNQGGDPFLAELYRRMGRLWYAADVKVLNQRGGLELPDATGYVPPLYRRCYAKKERVMEALDLWSIHCVQWAQANGLQELLTCKLTLDILVPCGRAAGESLRKILDSASSVDSQTADVNFRLVVDAVPCSDEAEAEFKRLQASRHDKIRLRFNPANLGASRTRNKLLEESLARYVLFLDDDVEPQPHCVPAYVAAMKDPQNSEEVGFAGPCYLPHAQAGFNFSKRLLATSVHMADVAFFWEAASFSWWPNMRMPWSITASVAFKNTGKVAFSPEFLKSGGGEDVDACLQAGKIAREDGSYFYKGLRCVPEAEAQHPYWNNGRLTLSRFFKWSLGDGLLVDLYQSDLVYRSSFSGPELVVMTLPLALLFVKPWLPLSIFLTDFLIDLPREFLLKVRRDRQNYCPSLAFRILAVLYAEAIKYSSEYGKIWGHLLRRGPWGLLLRLGRRFDWFGGFMPEIPRKERAWAGVRFLLYGVAVLVVMEAWLAASILAAAASAAVFALHRRGWVD